jgi:hypothetical protein
VIAILKYPPAESPVANYLKATRFNKDGKIELEFRGEGL